MHGKHREGLTVSLTDTDFASSAPTGIAKAVGGDINGGGIVFEYYGDTNNQEFGRSFNIASIIIDGDREFQEVRQGSVDLDPVGSLTMSFTTGIPTDDPEALVSFQTWLQVEGTPQADPVTIGGNVTGLVGSGTVPPDPVSNVAVVCAPPDTPAAKTAFLPGAVYLNLLLDN